MEYDAATKTAVLTRGDYTCTLTVGSPVVQYGDGQSLTSPVPTIAEIVDGTLYLFPFGFDRTLWRESYRAVDTLRGYTTDEWDYEELIKLYEEAAALGKKLTKTLTEIQRKVEKVTSDNEMELETEPFEEDEE